MESAYADRAVVASLTNLVFEHQTRITNLSRQVFCLHLFILAVLFYLALK